MNRTVTIVSTLALGAALGMAVGSGMLNSGGRPERGDDVGQRRAGRDRGRGHFRSI